MSAPGRRPEYSNRVHKPSTAAHLVGPAAVPHIPDTERGSCGDKPRERLANRLAGTPRICPTFLFSHALSARRVARAVDQVCVSCLDQFTLGSDDGHAPASHDPLVVRLRLVERDATITEIYGETIEREVVVEVEVR